MPTTCLFDIGNVIVRFDFQIAIKKVADRCRLEPEAMLPALRPLTDAFELGEMETDAFVAEATTTLGFTGEADEFIRAFADIFTLNEPIADLIAELDSAGARLCYLSNTNAIHVPFFTETWPEVFGRFENGVYSHEAGAMKPDPRIFEIAIEQLDLDPAATLYIDDHLPNIETGREFGFQTHRYDHREHESLLEALSPPDRVESSP